MRTLAAVFIILGLMMFAQSYHNLDLSYNNKFSFIDIGNGWDGPTMHTAGLAGIFISVSVLCLATIVEGWKK